MKREIRTSAIAGVAGVGAVIDVGQESFIIPGIGEWRQSQLRVIELPRLSSRLRKLLKAPGEGEPTLLVSRFPRTMFCERCRKMLTWKTELEKDGEVPRCSESGCNGELVPMRFVVACEHGHLDDVNWRFWAHSGPNGKPECRATDQLSFVVNTAGRDAGLGSLRVQCGACKGWRSLEDIANKDEFRKLFKSCDGRHPWIWGRPDACEADVVVLQRGATNLHYPKTISALDIPIDVAVDLAAEYAGQVRAHPKYAKLVGLLKSVDGDKEFIELHIELLAAAVGCDKGVVRDVAQAEADGRPIGGPADGGTSSPLEQDVLLEEEWRTMVEALAHGGMTGSHFSATVEPLAPHAPAWMTTLVDGVLLIRRLRVVSAYLGFQRVKPSADNQMVPPDVGGAESWLPAAEVFGEGIVLKLDYARLAAWADSLPEPVTVALEKLDRKREDENFWFLPKIDPIFVAMHTLSHLLLRRITFECGYSSSSLRERLYFNRENLTAGIMIYTADGDSEGSLGGLVRQGRRDRLAQSLGEAVEQGAWCSSDPVCTETAGQGLGGFNHAACHACSLVSETSCTAANTLLDRRMLYHPEWGLLRYLGKQE
ncbi:DUF1998 domain-containing protein [Burkholderia vietnamiensis]|uniref:DUF1998 domain-containing protein n=1 Tax=Burkholderia vietnamiensis TaxID=60552 RepID=UPI000753F199|nr:DUF1998 domain-containing protein [Burkholderia vietnamiensis]KVR98555.1 hypothetical protein WK28_05705 [Burkholderia vietnamiensis]